MSEGAKIQTLWNVLVPNHCCGFDERDFPDWRRLAATVDHSFKGQISSACCWLLVRPVRGRVVHRESLVTHRSLVVDPTSESLAVATPVALRRVAFPFGKATSGATWMGTQIGAPCRPLRTDETKFARRQTGVR